MKLSHSLVWFAFATITTGCTLEGAPGEEGSPSSSLDGDDDLAGNPSDHAFLLAPPLLEQAASQRRLDNLPVVHAKDGTMRAAPMPVKDGAEASLNPANRATWIVGAVDLVYYYYIELPLPSYVTDADGGTIRLIMQHEIDGYDQVRVIDEHIGTEYIDNTYGARGRFPGRYGWTRQSGGGEWSWILGDGTAHNLATPWDWAFITDYRWLQDNTVLPGDTIRVYTHPHVTARVVFMD